MEHFPVLSNAGGPGTWDLDFPESLAAGFCLGWHVGAREDWKAAAVGPLGTQVPTPAVAVRDTGGQGTERAAASVDGLALAELLRGTQALVLVVQPGQGSSQP